MRWCGYVKQLERGASFKEEGGAWREREGRKKIRPTEAMERGDGEKGAGKEK